MAVFTLEDSQGSVEVVVFPETFGRFRHLIETGALLLVRGKFERDEESSRFLAAELSPLEGLRERLARGGRHPPERERLARHARSAVGRAGPAPGRPAESSLELEVAHQTGRLRVRADVTPQIRVRPSEQLVVGGRAGLRCRLGRAAIDWGT